MVALVNRTIWGEPVGKYQLGTYDDTGFETALLGKTIGEKPVFSLSVLNVPIPERQKLEISDMGNLVLGAVIGVALSKLM